jgi:hypothetical protein
MISQLKGEGCQGANTLKKNEKKALPETRITFLQIP